MIKESCAMCGGCDHPPDKGGLRAWVGGFHPYVLDQKGCVFPLIATKFLSSPHLLISGASLCHCWRGVKSKVVLTQGFTW